MTEGTSAARSMLATDPAALDAAVALLADGQLVALPTETVYGLAGVSTLPGPVARIYQVKGRPSHNPLISHVSGIEMAQRYVQFDPISLALADAFWPGPLTLVLPLLPGTGISRDSTAGGETAAIRAPRGFAHDLIAKLDLPLAMPSANPSGKISPTTAAHVMSSLGHALPLIIDGGATEFGLESTVVRVEGDGVRILRAGVITADLIHAATGMTVLGIPQDQGDEAAALPSPGMLSSHYAPRAQVRINATEVQPGEAVITFAGRVLPGQELAGSVQDLSPAGDLAEAAHRLFELLHLADASGAPSIAVAPIPETGIGAAIADRLGRAAAPREA